MVVQNPIIIIIKFLKPKSHYGGEKYVHFSTTTSVKVLSDTISLEKIVPKHNGHDKIIKKIPIS